MPLEPAPALHSTQALWWRGGRRSTGQLRMTAVRSELELQETQAPNFSALPRIAPSRVSCSLGMQREQGKVAAQELLESNSFKFLD